MLQRRQHQRRQHQIPKQQRRADQNAQHADAAAQQARIGHLALGHIDLRLAALLTAFEVAGVWLGVQLGHAVDARLLRRGVGVLCVLVGAALLFRDLVLRAL